MAWEQSLEAFAFRRGSNHKDFPIEEVFRVDFLVEGEIVVEIKSVDSLAPIHTAQLLTYLRFLKLKTALLLNFNVPILTSGLKRISL